MIEYKINEQISADQYIGLLNKSTLGERRPVDDKACVEGMISNSNLIVSAWLDTELIGVARSVTDFHYACYLSDLAVDEKYQRKGIGKKLQTLTQEQLGAKCTMILLAAPAAKDYYSYIGFSSHDSCWVLRRDKRL